MNAPAELNIEIQLEHCIPFRIQHRSEMARIKLGVFQIIC